MFSQMVFQPDAQGRPFSDNDAEQLMLLGVARVYKGEVLDPYAQDIPRLMHGQYHVPAAGFRRDGHVFVSRQALEVALWQYKSNPARLATERKTLLWRLLFDANVPYEVEYDAARSLYSFSRLAAPTPA